MATLSVIILTKNEEEMIDECLKSIEWVDEIVLIDDESSDKTVEIGKKFGAKVFTHKLKDFSDQRNFGFKQASSDWIFYLDADERITSDLAEEIKMIIKNPHFSAYTIARKNFYLGREWPYKEKIIRLFKKENFAGWQGELHESPKFTGKAGVLDGEIIHLTHRDLASMVTKTIDWSETEAYLRFRANHPKMTWWRFPRVMVTTFFNYYVKQRGFRAGMVGLVESLYQAFSIFITYARLWEMQKAK
ncbi:glycosyltransferase family 2 protein [Candidatus Gottesmanbacteria bacterium]|nr:glycosyltransferase family 2 protein [Candidatus Gottesmanbacteria bacterium]